MKKIIFILIIALTFIACNTAKKTITNDEKLIAKNETKSEVKQLVKIETDSTVVIANKNDIAIITDVEIDKSENITIINYDTDKPVLPATGKPPIKTETIIKRNSRDRENKEIIDKGTIETKADYKSSQEQTLEEKNKNSQNTKIEQKEKIESKDKDYIPIVIILITILTIGLLTFLLSRLKKII